MRRLAVISLSAVEPEKLGREDTVAYLEGSNDETELIDFTVPLLPYPFTKLLYSASSCCIAYWKALNTGGSADSSDDVSVNATLLEPTNFPYRAGDRLDVNTDLSAVKQFFG